MAKKFVATLVALGCIAAIMPFGVGLVAEKKIHELLKDSNEKMKNMITLSLTEYQRGWLSSKGTMQVTFNPKIYGELISDKPITLHETVYHGPVIWGKPGFQLALAATYNEFGINDLKKMEVKQETIDKIKSYFDNSYHHYPLLKIGNIILLTGKLNSYIKINPFVVKDKSTDIEARIVGINSNIIEDKKHKVAQGQIEIKDIEIKQKDLQINQKPIAIEFNRNDLNKETEQVLGLWNGTIHVNYENLSILKKEKEIFSLNGLILDKETHSNNDLWSVYSNIKINKVKLQNSDEYNTIDSKLKLNNIHAPSLVKLHEQFQSIQQDSKLPDAQKELMLLTLLPLLPKLADYGLDLNYELKFDSKDGLTRTQLALVVAKPQDANQITNDFSTYLKRVKADFQLSMPKPVFKRLLYFISSKEEAIEKSLNSQKNEQKSIDSSSEQLNNPNTSQPESTSKTHVSDNMIAKWLESKILIEEDNNYKYSLKFENGKLMINNKEQP